jgi:hypothetical protein
MIQFAARDWQRDIDSTADSLSLCYILADNLLTGVNGGLPDNTSTQFSNANNHMEARD